MGGGGALTIRRPIVFCIALLYVLVISYSSGPLYGRHGPARHIRCIAATGTAPHINTTVSPRMCQGIFINTTYMRATGTI